MTAVYLDLEVSNSTSASRRTYQHGMSCVADQHGHSVKTDEFVLLEHLMNRGRTTIS
jgi:hypothetical protein